MGAIEREGTGGEKGIEWFNGEDALLQLRFLWSFLSQGGMRWGPAAKGKTEREVCSGRDVGQLEKLVHGELRAVILYNLVVRMIF